jgi:hypothetical protein
MTATTLPGSVLPQNRLCYGVARNVIGVPNRTGRLAMPHLAHLIIPFSGAITLAA